MNMKIKCEICDRMFTTTNNKSKTCGVLCARSLITGRKLNRCVVCGIPLNIKSGPPQRFCGKLCKKANMTKGSPITKK